MAIRTVATSVVDAFYMRSVSTLAVVTTAEKLAPYCKEGIGITYHNDNSYVPDFYIPFPSTMTEGWVAFTMDTSDMSNANHWNHWMWSLRDMLHTGTKATFGMYVDINANTFTLQRPNGTAMMSAAATLSVGLHRFDVYFKLDSSAGAFIVYIDGVLATTYTGSVTETTANFTGINGLCFEAEGGSNATLRTISGIIISDSDTRGQVVAIDYPTGDGATNEFTGTYANVDEIGAADGLYMQANAAGLSALLQFDALNSALSAYTPVAAGLLLSGPGTWRGLNLLTRSGGVTYDAAVMKSNTEFNILSQVPGIAAVNPATSAPWTIAEINAAQFGFKTT